jgi:hypothetical protein
MYCYQVEYIEEGVVHQDRLFETIDSADRCYNATLYNLKKSHDLKCALRRGHGMEEEERMHCTNNESVILRLTVRTIRP